MHAAFIHQGTGHDPVIHKVAGDEPVIRVNIRLSTDHSLAVASTMGDDLIDPVHQPHSTTRDGQRLFDGQTAEQRSKAACQITLTQFVQLLSREPFPLQGYQILPVSRSDPGCRARVNQRSDNPFTSLKGGR